MINADVRNVKMEKPIKKSNLSSHFEIMRFVFIICAIKRVSAQAKTLT